MKSFLFTFFLGALIISSAIAQVGGQGRPAIVSPEVSTDGRVTFRLEAPMASTVSFPVILARIQK